MVLKPLISSYGNSFGNNTLSNQLGQHTPAGDINPDELHQNLLSDQVEFKDFQQTTRDYVLGMLGSPIIKVELTDVQVKMCTDDAIGKMDFHAPEWTRQFAVFDASATINIYEIPRYILNNLSYVVYKKTLLSIQQTAGTLEFDFFLKYFQDNHLFENFGIGDFLILQQNLEMTRKVLGQEGGWNVIDNQFLQLYPSPVVTPDPVILEYQALNSNTMHPAYRSWIQRFALAKAKGVLGQIRGKFASIPSPGGGVQLNGASLVQESTQEQATLMEELLTEIEQPPYFTTY